MSDKYPKLLCVIIMLSLFAPFFAFALPAVAGQDPMDLIKQTVKEARLVFNDSSLSQQQKIDKLRGIAEARFDFEETSRRALAGEWRQLSSAQRREFVSLFSRLIENVYSNKVKRYKKEIREQSEDRVIYLNERIDDQYATVRTSIMTTAGVQVSVDYRLVKMQGKWRIYDVVVEGVSLVNNYRTQFHDIIRGGSYEKLLGLLKEKVEK